MRKVIIATNVRTKQLPFIVMKTAFSLQPLLSEFDAAGS